MESKVLEPLLSFPGAYNLDTPREGIGLDVHLRKVVDLDPALPREKQWRPSAVLTVNLINNAGHRIPDG